MSGQIQVLPQTINFVLPDDRHLPSGGNLYNEKLIQALLQLGQSVKIMSFPEYHKAIQADKAGIYGVDSLFVEEMHKLLEYSPKKAFSFFIMHHLQSLFPPKGIDAEQYFLQAEAPVLRFFDAFLLTSEFSKAYLLEKKMEGHMMVVEPAYSVVDVPSSSLSKPLKAIMVANVVERKGILSFLEQLAYLSKAEDGFMINIIGRTDMEPAYYQSCQKLVQSSSLKSKVHFSGEMEHQEVLQQYSLHHLFVSAAQMETFGMAIQEAKSCGLPLLLCKGGFSERHLLKGKGLISPNIFKLAGNFIELCRNDRLMREYWQSAKVAHTSSQPYQWEQAAAFFLNLFRDFYI